MLRRHPDLICDTGHNPGGWEYIAPRLRELARKGPLRMVIGFVNDKDVGSILGMMPPQAEYFFTSPSVKRGRRAEQLQAEAAAHGLKGDAYPSVAEAVRAALRGFTPDGAVFVGGSTFVVADLLASELFSV